LDFFKEDRRLRCDFYQKSVPEAVPYLLSFSKLFFTLIIPSALAAGDYLFSVTDWKSNEDDPRGSERRIKLREGDPLIKSRIRSVKEEWQVVG